MLYISSAVQLLMRSPAIDWQTGLEPVERSFSEICDHQNRRRFNRFIQYIICLMF
jgi:hypothetical protein